MIAEIILPWIGNILILLGAFFALTGAVGLLRMPDLFTRLHPAGVTDSLAIPCILIGLMFHAALLLTIGKLLLLMLFLLLTSPTACHALAKAAYIPEALNNPKQPSKKPDETEAVRKGGKK